MTIISVNNVDMGYCEPCGNYVPVIWVEGDLLCKYEYDDYGDMATVIR